MLDFFYLIRFPNLLVVALTQALIYFRVLLPAYTQTGLEPALNTVQFVLLVLVTMIVTAGGYVINDMLDARSDMVNRPGTNKVYQIGTGQVRWLYTTSILLGFAISFLLAFELGERKLLWLYPLMVSLLALYSRWIKPIPFAGNILVAIYCAGVPALVALAERKQLALVAKIDAEVATSTWQIIGVYCLFAFVATLLRELVKDIQDIHGDRVIGRRTIPILWGIKTSRLIGILLSGLILAAVSIPVLLGWPAFIHPIILTFMATLSMSTLYFMYLLVRSQEPRDFGKISTQLKLFLLAGLGLLVFI